jgi:hypothetical protein
MYVASGLLFLAIMIGAVLFLVLLLRPAQSMAVAVGGQRATECPPGTGAPACFRFDVTNTGERDGVAICVVTPAPQTEATFVNGSRTADVVLSAGEVRQIYAKVTPAGGGDTVYAPTIACTAP